MPLKVISWNLWHRGGAVLAHLAALIEAEKPDLLLMQEAKPNLSELTDVVGGHFHFLPLPKRVQQPRFSQAGRFATRK